MTVELDKLDIHNRQQLSALMDGELSPDEARFLLRRLQHDGELNACWERGGVRRRAARPGPSAGAGRLRRPGGAGRGRRGPPAVRQPGNDRRAAWPPGPLGPVAALAASVALVALFMARQQAPQDDAASAAPSVAAVPAAPVEGTGVPATADTGTLADGAGAAEQALASAATAAVAVASVPRRADAASRRSATRTQQAARSAASRVMREPVRAVARVAPPVSLPATTANNTPVLPGTVSPAAAIARNGDPFSPAPAAPQARPWPRSTLSQYPASGAFNAGFSSDSGARTFYPFEPSPEASSVPPVEPARAPQR